MGDTLSINVLDYYVEKFKNLKRNSATSDSPHKPILLLSVIELYEKGVYSSRFIDFRDELETVFKDIWNYLPTPNNGRPNIVLPLYHMKSEGFWKLYPKKGFESEMNIKIKAKTRFHEVVSHIEIDEDLFRLILNPLSREVLKMGLLNKYFGGFSLLPNDKEKLLDKDSISLYSENNHKKQLENCIRELDNLEKSNDPKKYTQEKYIRDATFKWRIYRIYQNTCAISGSRIASNVSSVLMIDACHIEEFNIAKDNSTTNGIALCPNLHRAFDRGLISIDDNYRVLIKSKEIFTENECSSYNIRQFEKKEIYLPDCSEFYPSQEKLWEHRKRFGF